MEPTHVGCYGEIKKPSPLPGWVVKTKTELGLFLAAERHESRSTQTGQRQNRRFRNGSHAEGGEAAAPAPHAEGAYGA